MERYHMFKLGWAILFYAAYCIRPMPVSGLRSTRLVTNQTLRPQDYNVFYQGVDGTPGVDFPVLSFIPRTTFSCDGIESGYYADLDTDCQVFHICEEGKKISFLCPNGTIFEQADLICEWWYKVNCTNAPSLYQESAEFLREDLARRKASRRISLDGRERNHGAVMRIEESASISAQQNGKPYRVSSSRGQAGSVDFGRSSNNPSRGSNLIQSAIDKDVQNVPQKRYNDADTGNFINNENRDSSNRVQYSGPSSTSVERQLYTRSTTPSSLGGYASNLGDIPSRKQLNKNRGNVRFSSEFGSKVASTQGSTLRPTTDGYDLAFPTHRSEVVVNSFRPNPASGSNTVKIDSSKVNLGQPKQKSTVPLTRNDILNRRLEPTDSDELQIPQETAAFSPNSYNSLQSSTKKFTSSPYSNHRPTYSDLKRPDFSSTKLVKPINSVTPQYITTQSINSGKPFIGSTVGGSVFNKNSGRTNQNEEAIKPFVTTEKSPSAFENFSLDPTTPWYELSKTQQNEGTTGPISTTERTVPYTVQPVISSTQYNFDDNSLRLSSTPRDEFLKIRQNEENYAPISTSERVPYTVQPVISSTYHTVTDNQVFSSTPQDESLRIHVNEQTTGPFSTTERAVPYTLQPDVSSTFQSFPGNNQGFSSTSQPGLSSTASPPIESKTTRTVDHATVYGSFSRGPTTAAPQNGVEVKLGKNVDKISIQLSKSLGGEPPKYGSTAGPQLATDGFVRITAGLSQPVLGSASQVNLRPGSGRGSNFPSPTNGKGIATSISTLGNGATVIGSGGIGTVGSTVVPNTLSLSETTSFTADNSVNNGNSGSTLIPSHLTPEIRVNNFQSTTASPGLTEIETGTTGNLDNFANTGTPSPDAANSQNGFGRNTGRGSIKFNTNTATGDSADNGFTNGNTGSYNNNRGTTTVFSNTASTVTPNVQIATGSATNGFTNGNTGSYSSNGGSTPVFGGIASTGAPNVQISTGSSLSGSTLSGTVQPVVDITGSTLLPDVGSTVIPGSFGYGSNTGSNPASNVVVTRISNSALNSIIGGNGLATGGAGISVVPNVASVGTTDGDLNTGYPSSSVRPNVYISENSRNTVSPPANGGYDYSTVSSVTAGPHSQVTELLPISETSAGPFKKINGSDAHLNSFRSSFYPTRSRDNTASAPSSVSEPQGPVSEDSSHKTVPSSIKTFASDIQGTVPSSLRPHSVEINLSQNDIGSTLSPVDEVSTYRSISTQKSNDFKSSSTRPAVTGTGFFVTRNSVYGSTTPAPFGLSTSTTSSFPSSTLLVNVSPNSGEETSSSEVTLSPPILDTLSKSETRYPRPFEKSLNSIDDDSSSTKIDSVTPTYFTYKISSARPFELPKDKVTPAPTVPTPFTTARSVQENVDDMINTLKEIVDNQDYSSETPRPGLVVPPSAGPQTLHTLAQYFANALDGIVAEREKETGEELDPESKEKLTSLLTQMTMYRYNELFKGTIPNNEESEEGTTTATTEDELEEGDSNNLVETPQLRELARNFSLALSDYLKDPDAFRKELETFRPTEPSTISDELTEGGTGDEELLNFSDADSKTSFNPLFSTPQAPAPTWGFIVAPKTAEDLDVKNSLNPDLHTADSQSFVPGFNNLAANTGKGFDKGSVGTKNDAPGAHWTASPGVTKLWQSALSVNPAVLNENLHTTRPISYTTEPYIAGTTATPLEYPQSEIQYDLRALPKLTLNSTQVHGILIDFVNTTKPDDSNRLQRLLKKLNTTEDEFLHRMKEIESNPLTKRLILLLISECGANVTKDLEKDPIHSLSELLNSSSSDPEAVGHVEGRTLNSDIPELVDPALQQDDQDTRALQLLNSLYAIASKFGK